MQRMKLEKGRIILFRKRISVLSCLEGSVPSIGSTANVNSLFSSNSRRDSSVIIFASGNLEAISSPTE